MISSKFENGHLEQTYLLGPKSLLLVSEGFIKGPRGGEDGGGTGFPSSE